MEGHERKKGKTDRREWKGRDNGGFGKRNKKMNDVERQRRERKGKEGKGMKEEKGKEGRE